MKQLRAFLVLLALCALATGVFSPVLAGPKAQAVPKVGFCPSGYSTSGNYCKPSSNARYALVKVGFCPSGYSTSGDYCLANSSTGRHALPKDGFCPSGYSTSGDYCLAN